MKTIILLLCVMSFALHDTQAQNLEAGQSVTITCDAPKMEAHPVVAPKPVTPVKPPANYSCGRSTILRHNVQAYYNAHGNALNISRFRKGEVYVLSFRTGPVSPNLQTVDIVEWSGQPVVRHATISRWQCNFVDPDVVGAGVRPNLNFSVGQPIKRGIIGDNYHPMLLPNTDYKINVRNGAAEDTCTTNQCGFNFKFFGTQ